MDVAILDIDGDRVVAAAATLAKAHHVEVLGERVDVSSAADLERAATAVQELVFPSGMITRHLESSAAARPDDLGGGDVATEDLAAMMASRPMSEADLTTAEDAARHALDGVLAGEPYVVTHGDLTAAVVANQTAILRALERAAPSQ